MKFLKSSGEFEKRRRRILWAEVLEITHHLVNEGTVQLQSDSSYVLERVLRREMTPHAAGRALLAMLARSPVREVQDV